MSLKKMDPLLAIARIILIIMQALMAFAALATAIAVPAIFIFRSTVEAELVSDGVPLEAFTALASIIAVAGIVAALVFWVARLLSRVVGTVQEGDPFVPENATRLSRMAWIMLVIQILSIPLVALATWLDGITGDTNPGDNGISLSALLLVLILFILARVFRKGTEMREELEGTV